MMKQNQLYNDEIKDIIQEPYNWGKFRDKTILLSGASGAIGRVIVDVIMELNSSKNLHCQILAVSRDAEKARKVFSDYWNNDNFTFISCDITQGICIQEKVDYVVHAASNTHPLLYAKDPIGTITTNTLGTYYLMELAAEQKAEFLMMSSVEIYGENISQNSGFNENDMGYINCATLRAGYPESKRVAESLCYAFANQKGMKFKIVRLARVYGATMTGEDSRAIAQFFHKAVERKDIILKSDGQQLFSYVYVMDCVSGIFAVLLNGENEEVYNISGTNSIITLYDLARLIAEEFGVDVIRKMPEKLEKQGFSKATYAVLNNQKLISLGWKEKTPIIQGIRKVRKQWE